MTAIAAWLLGWERFWVSCITVFVAFSWRWFCLCSFARFRFPGGEGGLCESALKSRFCARISVGSGVLSCICFLAPLFLHFFPLSLSAWVSSWSHRRKEGVNQHYRPSPDIHYQQIVRIRFMAAKQAIDRSVNGTLNQASTQSLKRSLGWVVKLVCPLLSCGCGFLVAAACCWCCSCRRRRRCCLLIAVVIAAAWPLS